MAILYLDCFSGISGDMMIGVLTDLGVTPSTFEWELSKLELGDYHLHFQREVRGRISGIRFSVHGGATHVHSETSEKEHRESHHVHHHPHSQYHVHEPVQGDVSSKSDPEQSRQQEREAGPKGSHDVEAPIRTFTSIEKLLHSSDLSDFVKHHAISIFKRIGDAEAKIHGVPIEEVHFHEVGALDSIVDIVGCCIGLENLGIKEIHFSDLVDGHGTFECAHGTLPIPAPATLQILEGVQIRQIAVEQELITPTGAAIVAEFQGSIGMMPSLAPKKIGYGLGSRHLPNRPNALRGVLADQPISAGTDRILEISVNVDDLSPEILGNTMDKLLRAGAVESYFTPVHMKKNRLGVLITVLVDRSKLDAIQRILFQETTTFGLRYREVERIMLERDIVKVSTPAGEIELKIGRLGDELLQASPEFESCKKAADSSGIPLRQVYQMANDAFFRSSKSKTS